MPLFEFSAQLNSTCNLKSSNFESLISSGPFPGVIKAPSSTFHTLVGWGLSVRQPVRSLPLNSGMGCPHFGFPLLFSAGARRPVQVQGVPSGPVVVPESRSLVSDPSNTISSLRSSSSLGETNRMWSPETETCGRGRAFPHRLTNCAHNCPSSSRISIQEGCSRSGVFNVRSQRPRNLLVLPASCGVFPETCSLPSQQVSGSSTTSDNNAIR